MFKKFLYNHDWIITSMMLLILAIGLVTIYSTSIGISGATDFQRQIIFSIAGLCIYFVISISDYSYFQYKPVVALAYGADILLLILGALAGHNVRGATRWLNFGSLNIQPSEITKVVLILSLSSFLTAATITKYKKLIYTLVIVLPLGILVFIEPSLSSTIVLLVVASAIFFFSGEDQVQYLFIFILLLLGMNIGGRFFMPHLILPVIKGVSLGIIILAVITGICMTIMKQISVKVVFIALIIGIVLGFSAKDVFWSKVLKPYQKARIISFIAPTQNNAQDIGAFQVTQSKIAIGSGELLGKGFAQGTQSRLNFLPDHNTDFIFASFSEEFGLLGDSILIGLFFILYFRVLGIAEKVTDRFGFLIIMGISAILIFQTFANIFINIGMLPSTGIPMPLVSYGGSSLWVTFILLGFSQSIYKKTKDKKWGNIEI